MEAVSDIVKNAVSAFAAGGGGATVYTATLTLPGACGVFEHSEALSHVGALATHRVQVWLQPGADDDENVAEMIDLSTVWATPNTNTITFGASFRDTSSGPIKIFYTVN